MKPADIFLTANSNMFRSKLRSILTIIAIFIGSLTLTLTNGIGSGIASYIDEQLGNVGAKDMLVIQAKSDSPFGGNGPQKYEEGRKTSSTAGIPMQLLNKNDLETIRHTPGIRSATFELNVAPDFITGVNGEKFKFTGRAYYDGVNITLRGGKLPDNVLRQRQILLTPEFPAALGYASADEAVGNLVKIGIKTPGGDQRLVTATVVGVQEQTLMSAGGLLMNQSLNRSLFDIQTEGLPSSVRDNQPIITARFDASKSDEDTRLLKQDLSSKGYEASTISDRIGILKQVIDAIIIVLNFFAGIALLAASFGIVNTLLMAVQERTKEIGLMIAMGMSRRKIFLLFSAEAVMLGFWGSLLGVLAGVGAGKVANQIASRTFLKDLVGFELTSFPLVAILVIIGAIMTIAFIAGTFPAGRAGKKDPIEALRYE